MTKDYKSLSDSLSELQQHSIDGESPTFGRVVKMLASLVPLLIELEPYWKEPAVFYHELSPRTKEMIDDTIKLLDEVGREIFQPVSIILGSAGFTLALMEIAVPTQMWRDTGSSYATSNIPRRLTPENISCPWEGCRKKAGALLSTPMAHMDIIVDLMLMVVGTLSYIIIAATICHSRLLMKKHSGSRK